MSENGQWNEDVIRQSFVPVDAAAILRTPARVQYEDMWAWEPEKHRVYSVRSAYRLLDMARVKETNVQDASTSGSNVWKKVWKLKIAPKIKVFWWRVLHEFLPSHQILHCKHIEPTAHCEVCGSDSESIGHVPVIARSLKLSGLRLLLLQVSNSRLYILKPGHTT